MNVRSYSLKPRLTKYTNNKFFATPASGPFSQSLSHTLVMCSCST